MTGSIKEDIVTFETAKLANDLGFTRETMGFKTSSVSKDYYNHLGEFNGDCTLNVKSFLDKDDVNKYPLIAAPTQSLLQKWLREEHSIHIEVIYVGKNKWSYSLNNMSNGLNGSYSIYYDTYEETLEMGLRKGLELI